MMRDRLIQVTLKGLADFVTADHLRLRALLHDFKYPKSDEARAKILYYREARDTVLAYHRGDHPPNWLVDQAAALDAEAALACGMARPRLKHNARALRDYREHFADRHFEAILPPRKFSLTYSGVTISVVPDFRARERGRERIVKLEFGVDPLDALTAKVMAQTMFEAAAAAGQTLASSGVLVFDVARGSETRGGRVGARVGRLVEATCRNIAAIWDSV